MSNLDKPPVLAFCIVGLLCLAAIILIIKTLFEGFLYFLEDGGWIWLLVVGGLILFVVLIIIASGK